MMKETASSTKFRRKLYTIQNSKFHQHNRKSPPFVTRALRRRSSASLPLSPLTLPASSLSQIGVGIGGGGGRGRGLVGSEIHGFRTVEDLDINGIRNEARSRWLQPNEILAILSNSSYFRINSKPVNLPQSGTMLLFDRKTLRNFRKDGHNWKKKKDGKTVKEAHEHLKVGGVERIHVYYAHGEDKPNFVRRCYWLLDKAMEHIVLVHYRETQEEGSPVTPKLSYSSSEISDLSSSQLVLEEISSEYDRASTNGQLGFADIGNARNNAMKLQELDTSGWDELLGSTDPNNSIVAAGDGLHNKFASRNVYIGKFRRIEFELHE
ncbi:Calmodulin-binding transcription activator 5-like protein [Drosera capensis]